MAALDTARRRGPEHLDGRHLLDDVFGRQVQFSEGGSITSVTAMSSGGGAGGSYINHELVSDFSLSTAKNANSQVGVRSPGSVQLYNCSENASLASPITGEAA